MNEQRVIPERFRIEDLDSWLLSNGLRAPGDGDEPTLDRQDEMARFEELQRYQTSVHARIFRDEQDETSQERKKQLRIWKTQSQELRIVSADGRAIHVELWSLAESCDTIFALASTWGEYGSDKPISFNLDFSAASIQAFVDIVVGSSRTSDLASDVVVDCCCMAHYVQNNTILEEIVEILAQSVDTTNCLSMSQLADHLNLPNLLERSLSIMLDSLGDVEDSASELLTPELLERIFAIKSAIQSSIHSQRSRLYFSSLDEYLAIFAERVQYYRERLAEAKEQQAILVETESLSEQYFRDSQAKIHKQEVRVRTLECALAEQKILFANKRMRHE